MPHLTTTLRDTALAARRRGRCPTRQSGVTLIELIIVIVLMGILVAIGVPSYQSITTSSRMSSESNSLLGDLQYARAEAIREGSPVTVCIANITGSACNAAGTTWQGGWIVFSDVNDDQTVDPGDAVLRVQRAFSGTDTFASSNNDYAVTFTREGFASFGGGGTLSIILHNAAANKYYSRCLNISLGGMMSVQSNYTEAGCT